MIKQLIKDFTLDELEKLMDTNLYRFKELCNIIGRFELDRRYLFVGVVLPYKDDKGCVSATIIEDGKMNITDTRYF
jgi:hypothetical protein